MTEGVPKETPAEGTASPLLPLLLAAAMFVLVVDTSLMNVSISAVVGDLDTTVSNVQAAIALEALVSAAFILIGSKVGDLIGRKRAFVLGLVAYAIGSARDDAGAGPYCDHRLLGDHRRSRSVAADAGDAVADPRELRGGGSDEDVRAGGRICRDRCRCRPLDRWFCDHVPFVACRLRARGRRDRGRVVPDQARPRRRLHRAALNSISLARSFRSLAWAVSCSAFSSGRRAANSSRC